ncbi:hypothetical protein, partial [Clostridioides difficile]|uniref:hypothetical protein n=1 Tax=Clostridioides difficile TaxID=1496 RepID=UPI001A9C277B
LSTPSFADTTRRCDVWAHIIAAIAPGPPLATPARVGDFQRVQTFNVRPFDAPPGLPALRQKLRDFLAANLPA